MVYNFNNITALGRPAVNIEHLDMADSTEMGGPAEDPIHTNTANNPDDEMVELKSSDEKVIKVKRSVIEQCVTIKNLYEDLGDMTSVVPIHNVDSETLEKIIEFCVAHKVCHFLYFIKQ